MSNAIYAKIDSVASCFLELGEYSSNEYNFMNRLTPDSIDTLERFIKKQQIKFEIKKSIDTMCQWFPYELLCERGLFLSNFGQELYEDICEFNK